ncbi:hypothetical protein [Phytobacter diazotrophicus]|uniref:hypothetical protein n=1 Tax=Phytobacter diazotrophicus TaxID=395631 RepID=UPI002FF4EC86
MANMLTAGSIALLAQYNTPDFQNATSGRLINKQVFSTPGSFTYNKTEGPHGVLCKLKRQVAREAMHRVLRHQMSQLRQVEVLEHMRNQDYPPFLTLPLWLWVLEEIRVILAVTLHLAASLPMAALRVIAIWLAHGLTRQKLGTFAEQMAELLPEET